jgi:hypothetical protein
MGTYSKTSSDGISNAKFIQSMSRFDCRVPDVRRNEAEDLLQIHRVYSSPRDLSIGSLHSLT